MLVHSEEIQAENATRISQITHYLGNSDYFVIIASLHSFLLTEHAVNGQVEAPLK